MYDAYGFYQIDPDQHYAEDWAHDMANEFEAKLSLIIKDKDYLKDIGLSLAYSVYNSEDSEFFIDNNLQIEHALCYLYRYCDAYKKEVAEACYAYHSGV